LSRSSHEGEDNESVESLKAETPAEPIRLKKKKTSFKKKWKVKTKIEDQPIHADVDFSWEADFNIPFESTDERLAEDQLE